MIVDIFSSNHLGFQEKLGIFVHVSLLERPQEYLMAVLCGLCLGLWEF